MTYKTKLLVSTISTLVLIATITICIRIYWYQHSIMQNWGSTLDIVNMFLNMAVVIVGLALINKHYRKSGQ
ncbi:MAG: hypothetical protein M3R43_09470 [Acidobacteriota bacterium]|nr:hypothetical protein [Acidobacteriota bacterium]